jgi:hypothetical protein
MLVGKSAPPQSRVLLVYQCASGSRSQHQNCTDVSLLKQLDTAEFATLDPSWVDESLDNIDISTPSSSPRPFGFLHAALNRSEPIPLRPTFFYSGTYVMVSLNTSTVGFIDTASWALTTTQRSESARNINFYADRYYVSIAYDHYDHTSSLGQVRMLGTYDNNHLAIVSYEESVSSADLPTAYSARFFPPYYYIGDGF